MGVAAWCELPFALIALGHEEARLARFLAPRFPLASLYIHANAAGVGERSFPQIAPCIAHLFASARALVVVAPMGVVVRSLAGLPRSKYTDPAIVVVDTGGRYAISLLSCHEGSGNTLALAVADALGAEPVISTTSEASKRLIVGLGCRRGADQADVVACVRQALAEVNAEVEQVRWLASVEAKRGEPGLVAAAQTLGIPLRFVAKEALRLWCRTESPYVRRALGVPAVAEPAAMLAGTRTRCVLPKTIFRAGITVAIAVEDWPWLASRVADTELESLESAAPPLGQGACLIDASASRLGIGEPSASACELARRSNPGRRWGGLAVVGIGPGHRDDRTHRAERAIRRAEVLVGYAPYLDSISDLMANQQRIATAMGQERERVDAAIDAALAGLPVALVSSGDPGIYGMAGALLERLVERQLKFPVEVVPGVTAASAVAARLGAPLMLDYAAISLSDLLVPWATIRERLEHVAQADLVVALYSPRSRTRKQELTEARAILLRYRSPGTPVGFARALGSTEEALFLSTLGGFCEDDIDMRTLLVVGNRTTKVAQGWMVTPRGYWP